MANSHLLKTSLDYTPEEVAQATKSYLDTMSKEIQDRSIIKTKVIDITGKHVVLSTDLKHDGIVSLAEFKDIPHIKIGDAVEIYVEHAENKYGEIVLSRKKLKPIKSQQAIQESLLAKTTLEATVKKTSPGGLIASIGGVEVFLPGSQIDLTSVTDYQAFVDTTIDVMVIKINHTKKNFIVSRKAVIKKRIEEQKKAIIDKLEEGQIREGIVKNIEKYGAFVDLGGIVGLVYVKDMVWDRRIDHPSKAKDDEGNIIFEKDKKVKVVVLNFDKEKNYVSLATKPLLKNPWQELDQKVKVGNIITCKVVKIMDYCAIVETSYGTEAFIHSSDMTRSTYMQHPKEILHIGQELETIVLHIDVEKQDLKVGVKQLLPDPWQTKDFFTKYGLDTKHQAKVTKFTEHGAYLELSSGIEGFLHNRHLSWTKKINAANKVLKKNTLYKVLIISIDESKKMLELGYREVEDSPWDSFEKIFLPGTIHEGEIIRKIPQGLIVQLAHGPESFIPHKDIKQEDKTSVDLGKKMNFVVLDFMRLEEKIRICHEDLVDKHTLDKLANKPQDTPSTITEKTTIGDVALVSGLNQKKLHTKNKEKEETKNESQSSSQESLTA